jgi:hypothetical protein
VILCFSAPQQMSKAQLDTLLPKINALKVGGIFFGSVSLIPEILSGARKIKCALISLSISSRSN